MLQLKIGLPFFGEAGLGEGVGESFSAPEDEDQIV